MNLKIINNKFKFNHIGAAVNDIQETIKTLKNFLDAKLLSDIVFDPIQNVNLILIDVKGITIELACGEKVRRFLIQKNGLNPYHICYEVRNFDKIITKYKNTPGLIMVAPPVPAILFNNRRIAFFIKKDIGLIEILEGDKM